MYKYIDQFAFALLNVGTILFISKFLVTEQAVKYIIISSLSSFSLVLVVALIISPFWIFCVKGEHQNEYFNFSIKLTLIVSTLISTILSLFHYIENESITDVLIIFSLGTLYPFYDFLRRALYVIHKESLAAMMTSFLCILTAISYFILFINNVQNYTFYLSVLVIFLALFICAILLLTRDFYLSSLVTHHSSWQKKLINYWSLGKWSMSSMICFWLATQGLFIYFGHTVADESIVTTRLCLSLAGIMAIYFSAIENKLMPQLRELFIINAIEKISEIRISYYKNSLIISIILMTLLFFGYYIFISEDIVNLNILLILCLHQPIIGLFKFESFYLKIKRFHFKVFISNFIALAITALSSLLLDKNSSNFLAYLILINGLVCSVFYIYFFYKNRDFTCATRQSDQ
ncbi:hypothetical protein I2494_18720 [Budviciaceae bacterium BWR-B9]|uniref:Uncharacterized protein n=2 Tax=Limnobaculum allomyrinae TaxID=2791986 RepID=A0ABS1IVD0_9GAMM|nr:hypothetical protein [Limnobaculum sp. M2-1]MBK5145710.1 hypothetical protein [Limnobaculum allomyrinae]